MDNKFSLAQGIVLQKRYLIQNKIGEGGMGAVYMAHDTRLKSQVAVKQTLFGDDEHLVRAFEREAALLANLSHHALPRVSDYFSDDSGIFIVMELIAGDDIEVMLEKRGGKLPVDEVKDLAYQLLNVLDYLHTQETSIIHKDIKPQNLKLTPRGQLKLLDFGLAKGKAGMMSTHTLTMLQGGTPLYASPEQMGGRVTDERSDIFSAAVVLYQMLCGATPPMAMERMSAGALGMDDPLRRASEVNGEVSKELAEILYAAMSLNPNNRPATAQEMLEKLKEVLEEKEKPGQNQLSAEHYYNLGTEYYDKEDYDNAIENYTKAMAFNPNYAEAYNDRATSYNYKGNYEQAIRDSNKALELKADYAEPYINLGFAYRNKHDYDQALEYCNKAIELQSNSAAAYSNRANIYEKKGNDAQAIKDYDKAVELEPTYYIAYNNRGVIYYKKGNYEQAVNDYSKAIELNSDEALYYSNRADGYEKLGERAKAKVDRQKYEELTKKT